MNSHPMFNFTFDQKTITFIGQKAIKIAFYLLGAIVVNKLIFIFCKKLKLVAGKMGERVGPAQLERLKTIRSLVRNTGKIVVNFVVLMMILSELGVNITPLLTGAGILGLAVGFGAKSLVADLIAGFFIIFENQFNVGDTVKIGTSKGKVVRISLRTIILKDKDGNRHIIPNSTIKTIIKFPKN